MFGYTIIKKKKLQELREAKEKELQELQEALKTTQELAHELCDESLISIIERQTEFEKFLCRKIAYYVRKYNEACDEVDALKLKKQRFMVKAEQFYDGDLI